LYNGAKYFLEKLIYNQTTDIVPRHDIRQINIAKSNEVNKRNLLIYARDFIGGKRMQQNDKIPLHHHPLSRRLLALHSLPLPLLLFLLLRPRHQEHLARCQLLRLLKKYRRFVTVSNVQQGQLQ